MSAITESEGAGGAEFGLAFQEIKERSMSVCRAAEFLDAWLPESAEEARAALRRAMDGVKAEVDRAWSGEHTTEVVLAHANAMQRLAQVCAGTFVGRIAESAPRPVEFMNNAADIFCRIRDRAQGHMDLEEKANAVLNGSAHGGNRAARRRAKKGK